jgi:hypothetical protein
VPIAGPACVVQKHVDRLIGKPCSESLDLRGYADIERLKADLRVTGGEFAKRAGSAQVASAGNHPPTGLGVLLDEFESQTAISASHEYYGRHVYLG